MSMNTTPPSAGPDESSSDVLLGQLLQHYVEDMTNFQVSVGRVRVEQGNFSVGLQSQGPTYPAHDNANSFCLRRA